MADLLRRTWAEVHLDRITANTQYIRQMLAPGCHMMGVVKADGYGHGALHAAKAILAGGADWLGVSNLEEGIQLRRGGIDCPILIISFTPASEVSRLVQYGLTQTVLSLEHAVELNTAAQAAGGTLRVHIKLDTGMSRVGFLCHSDEDIDTTVEQLQQIMTMPNLISEGIFTHFSSADEQEDSGYTHMQFARFTKTVDKAQEWGCHFALRHCCNSAATLRYPEMHLDMVRPGVILYGLTPDAWMAEQLSAFSPAMELKTTVSMVKDLPENTPMSYGRTYTTGAVCRIATVPIGYADGYSRAASNCACMLIAGRRAPVVGRVCMDQCMLDVSGLEEVREGTVVTVFGQDGEAVLSADELAAVFHTINYEVVCMVSRRVPRVYFQGKTQVDSVSYILQE